MQRPRWNSPAERHKDGKRKDVNRWEVREEGIRLDPFNRFDHSLEKMLIKNMCKWISRTFGGKEAGRGSKQNWTYFPLSILVDGSKLVWENGNEHGNQKHIT